MPLLNCRVLIWEIFALCAFWALPRSGQNRLFEVRARKNLAIIAVGPEGLCLPVNGVGPVAWHDVTRVRLVTVTIRGGARFTYIRFSFRPGAVKQWQFGSLRKNQWEIMITNGSWLTGDTCRILGGTERLLESVAQYHPIENL